MARYRYVNERSFRLLTDGIAFSQTDIHSLDEFLIGLEEKTRLISRLVDHNAKNGAKPPASQLGSGTIVVIEKTYQLPSGTPRLKVAAVRERESRSPGVALHVLLESISLKIPQRIEIPLRFILKGMPDLVDRYMVYLHALQMSDEKTLVYYGITKRGWMTRFGEHMNKALRESSPLLFHTTLREAIAGRMHQLGMTSPADGEFVSPRALVANYHVLCAAGLTKEQAFASEQYLVDKYSFDKPDGLNMIPGGDAGIIYLHKMRMISNGETPIDTDVRDALVEKFLRANPRRGIPNPKIAEHWADDDYAVKVICNGGKRLSLDQVRAIRAGVERGESLSAIVAVVGARSTAQVRRVIEGETYTRVR